MTIERLEIGYDCYFELLHFEGCETRVVSLEYVEHSPDGWYSNHNTSIDIDQSKAQEIVNFLCRHFNIQPMPA